MPRGGKREGSGPKKKPKEELTQSVSIYVPSNRIEAVGGKKTIKKAMRKAVDDMPIVNVDQKHKES